MEFLVIILICIIFLIILLKIFEVNLKKIKEMTNIKELDDIVSNYPENIEICKQYLKKLKNENAKIEEQPNSDATIYVAISNKICIGNLKKSYTRIQTIAHECLHSIQDKKILLFNFIFSNIYLIYFVITFIIACFGKLPYQMTFLAVLTILSLIYYTVRMYLENDAMIKARYLAKEYMIEKNISTKEEIDSVINQYDILNNIGIKCVHYQLLLNVFIKIILFSLVCFFR